MNHFFPKLLATALAATCLAQAQVSYTGGVYHQDFNTLPGTTNNTINSVWTDNTMLTGWYASKAGFGVTDGTIGGSAASFQATNVANNIGLFSFGTAGNADRALGSRATSQVAGNDPVLYGLRLVNNTAQTLTSFTVSYTGEQWFKSGDTSADTLLVDYQLGAAGISSGTWTAAAGGTFTSLVNTATAGTVAGNTAANRRGIATKVTGVSWAPGAELWVRFRDANDSGDEQGLAADDFSFIADNESGLFLNGSSSYVTMGQGASSAALNTSSFTVECRFMRTGAGATASTGTGGPTAIPLIAKGVGEADADPRDANYFIGIDSTTGKLCADFEQKNPTNNGTAYSAGQNFPVYGSTVLQNGVFYHVAATYDTATAIWKLYVNGVAETTTQTLPTFVGVVPNDLNTQGFGIGAAINSTGTRTGFLHGFIDEARVWNYARSAADIIASKDQEIAAAPGLLGRYGFEEGTGTTTAGTNASGAAAPVGTLTGSPLPIWVNSKLLVPNVLPTVALTLPADNSSVIFPAAVNFEASAADSDGLVTKVEFYQGAVKLGEDLTGPAPYTFSWTSAAVGNYTLTAVVTDNSGDRVTSAPVAFTVTPNPNQPTVVTLTGPANNATGVGASTTLSLGLADPEGDAQTVTFYGRKTMPAAPGADFSFIQVPDTQFYSENTGRNPSAGGTGAVIGIFNAQTQWISDNRDTRNIAFIGHMGDMVQNGDSILQEWINASGAMSTLENQAATLRPYGMPWGGAPGNHDFGTGSGTGTTTYWNQYFGTSRFAGRNYSGGNYGTDNNNNYQLFSASGLDFIVINLAYRATADTAVHDWADALLKAHPNRRGIVTSHWIINTGNPATFGGQGQAIYDNLKDNPNLFLLLCGHVHGEGRRSDVFAGRTVHSVLHDFQDASNGGNGFLRIFTFSPANNLITTETWSPILNRAATTADVSSSLGTFTLPYNMQSSLTDWIPLGTVNVPAGGTVADLNWTGLEKSSDYEWYATSFDGINTTISVSRRFSTAAAAAPVVTLTAPAAGASYALPATIEITADATDADGTVARVDFYQGGSKLFTDTEAPFAYSWTGASTGTYSLTATAVDNENRATLSNAVTVTVTNPNNVAPSVALTSPVDGSNVFANSSIPLAVTASDSDGTVSKVEFFLGATKVGEDLSSPFALSYNLGPVGSYTFTAKATDNDGGITTSASVTVNAQPAGPFSGSYAQGFDSALGTAGTVPPGAWTIWNGMTGTGNTTWTNATPTFGGANTVANSVGTMILSTAALTVSSAPAGNQNNGYNAAAPGDTANRLLATAPTSVSGTALQLELTNTGVEAITKVSVAYDIRRFLAVGTANELPGYWLFYSQDDGASWTNAPAFNTSISTVGTVQVPNTVGVTAVPATVVSLASPWAVGGTLRFRWVDDNAEQSSPDQIVGLDNVSILATETIPVIGTAPVVALTNPAANSSFLTSDTISIEADATDSDGTVTKVEFFRGAVKLGEDTTQPYAYSWSFPPAGSFSLTARATDSAGNLVSSAPRVVTVTLAPGSSGPMLRSPYLNQANHNSIVVRWRSTQSNIGRVRYGLTPGNLNLFTDETSAQTNHVVQLTGLTPATRYYYSVGSAVDILTPETVDTTSVRTTAFTIPAPTAADYTFRTSPVPGTAPAEGTRIWVVGDCGRGTATQAAGRDAYYNWMGSRTPDLNLQLGDNAYNAGNDAEYQSGYFAMYPTIFRKMPQWSTLGNHDANNGQTDPLLNHPYFDMFTFPTQGECGGTASGTEHYYSFDYGNVHFICLDSQTTLASRTANAPQTVWLQNDLASTTQPWKIVFFHHPPYSKGSHDSDGVGEGQMILMREIYNPIMEAGGVDLVLTGHSHNYERSVLLDGHYGYSSTITPAMKIDAGNGSTTGFTVGNSGKIRNAANNFTATATVNGTVIPPDGAYRKPLLGPLDHAGTIYNTAGMSGLADAGSIDHTAMYISYNTVGTVNLDITGNTLVATFMQADGNTPDNYTIVKAGEADRDRDGVSDSYEIANGLSRFNSSDAQASAGDSDGISNFLEFAFGLNPNLADGGSIIADVPNGLLSQRGQPTVWYQSTNTGTDFRALFIRRKNAVDAGLIYTPQFSGDLLSWTNSNVTPIVIADAGEVELVSVRYPFFAGGKKARYFRIAVSSGN